ncbi:MAG: S1C family serine protease [Eubacteriales bacterium]
MNNFINQDDDNTKDSDNNLSENPDKILQTPIIITDSRNDNFKLTASSKEKKAKKKNGLTRGFVSAAVTVCILFSGAAGFGGTYLANGISNGQSKASLANSTAVITSGDEDSVIYKPAVAAEDSENIYSNAITAVAAKAADSVVSISTETTAKDSFYGQYVTGGAGSGVIITENGYIITCAHVIDGASNISVKMSDGTEYKAEVIGSDLITDIAVIKIDKTGLPYAVIGDSGKILVGDDAVAIGNPLGELGGTVTNGIISALDREVEIAGQSYNLLQTNAAINPGNSGGGLFNLNGELIGVVNAKSSGSGIEGLGFAIPSNDAIKIAEQLIDNGYIKGRPKLGINALDVTKETDPWTLRSSKYADIINYITSYGVYFLNYAEYQTEGDLRFGDRIVAVDDIAISDMASLESILNDEYAPGDTIKITVARLTDVKAKRSEMVDMNIKLIESVPETAAGQQ